MNNEKICPTCGTEYAANERFCHRDGTALRSQGGGTDLVGSIIGERYHVLKKLGEGGMGQVYLAEHVKMGRKSAVKVMNPGMVNDADAISRFNREAANASRINHPNVAGIYDFGETSDGLIYLAMEFIEGESLTALVETAGALAPMRAADIAKQAADGLAVAHDMGIVHRDLKPDNIMIAKNRDGSDCVKVVDFGIAKAAGAENQKVTKTGLVVGTPEYMSPEQLAGDKLDGRSDVYSLALVAFNMLTGKLPFDGETAQESMIMRLTDEPKSLAAMKPDTTWTPEVQAVMARALQRRAGDRYQKASDFGVALWQAVERMPKQPAAGATMMIGATDGATALLAAPPKTRFDASAPVSPPAPFVPAAAAPVYTGTAPVKSKVPVIAGASAAVALAVVAAMFMTNRGSAPKAAADTAQIVTPVTASAITPTQTASGTIPSVTQSTSNPVARPPEPAAGGTSVPPFSKPPAEIPPSKVDISARLPTLIAESADEATAAKALKEASTLIPYAASPSEKIGLSLAKANAEALLGHDAKACDIIDTIKDRGASTPWAEKIAIMVKFCHP
ncbi:MAG: protein kinase [Gemmatimonadota bacterium]|nr:protein kinase [Gemmatimonadota bacterium]